MAEKLVPKLQIAGGEKCNSNNSHCHASVSYASISTFHQPHALDDGRRPSKTLKNRKHHVPSSGEALGFGSSINADLLPGNLLSFKPSHLSQCKQSAVVF